MSDKILTPAPIHRPPSTAPHHPRALLTFPTRFTPIISTLTRSPLVLLPPRGRVSFAGRSSVSPIALPKSQVEVELVRASSAGPISQSLLWTGKPQLLEFRVVASDVVTLLNAAAGAAQAGTGAQASAGSAEEEEGGGLSEGSVSFARSESKKRGMVASGVGDTAGPFRPWGLTSPRGDAGEGEGDASPKGTDIRGRLIMSLSSRSMTAVSSPPPVVSFNVDVLIHGFSPPSAPFDLRAGTRTNLCLCLQWELPATWGGCSLHKFEIQMKDEGIRSRTEAPAASSTVHAQALRGAQKKASSQALLDVGATSDDASSSGVGGPSLWRTVYEDLPETKNDRPEARLFMGVYAAQFRVRAYNVACATPSGWSEVFTLGTQAEEMSKKVVAVAQAGMIRRTKFVSDAKKRQANRISAAGGGGGPPSVTKKDSGLAVVEHGSITSGIGELVQRNMKGWSPFATALGNVFLELGVPGGVRGRLFDLTISQIEALASESDPSMAAGKAGAASGEAASGESPALASLDEASEVGPSAGADPAPPLDPAKAVLVLCSTAVWVMQTLAHHTDRPDEWIQLTNDVEGLVSLAAHHHMPFDAGVSTLLE